MIGAKRCTEDADSYRPSCISRWSPRWTIRVVGERSDCDEGKGVTHAGALRGENAGTSNHNESENLSRRKTEVSFATMIDEGLVGPKGMANAAPDGHTVNIP